MENSGLFACMLLLAAISALLGWGDFTGRIPPRYGGNRLSDKCFLISSALVLFSALTLAAGGREITGASFLAGVAVLCFSGLLRGRPGRKRKAKARPQFAESHLP
jgi:hypothetical protein